MTAAICMGEAFLYLRLPREVLDHAGSLDRPRMFSPGR
jgi:hypothetical protein